MADPARIESAVKCARDQRAFIQDLLIDALGWDIDEQAEDIEEISFEWSADELRAEGLAKHLVDGTIRQIRPMAGNPWGIFILEFNRPDVFATGRGMTGPLRKVLRGLVPSKKKKSSLASFSRENLLFICNHDYQHYRFVHFKTPEQDSQTAPLAAFGWGPGDPIRTLCEYNLTALEWPDGSPDAQGWIDTWSQAFDVEKVTKRFYADYAAVFARAEALIGKYCSQHTPCAVKGKDGTRRVPTTLKGDDLRMFTQTLFNRLMFLRFIERKQWLTFDGHNDYLRALYAAGGYRGKSFYKGRLRPLFFEGMSIEGKQQSEAYGRVPCLNGGLFEPTELDNRVPDLPDEVFEGILADERAGGLFYRYNFTVEESTPLDIEVAVDPEMLGKVFEELVTGRHESGSYYTPRPVVSFMCREALKGYLSGKVGNVVGTRRVPSASSRRVPSTPASQPAPPNVENPLHSAIAALVDQQDAGKLRETHAREIVAALDDLKAVDPACGSGAYLLGLLQEMVGLYRLLYSEKLVKDARSLYDLKLRIISQSLYGVDIDRFATNIAKLRLWLSLAVEADEPVPLPNLDFKIETGDSLLAPDPQEMPDLFRGLLQASADVLAIVKKQYFLAHGEEKEEYRHTIVSGEARLRKELAAEHGEGVVDWRIQFAEVFSNRRGGFDVVLANPPYVNMFSQDANAPEYRAALKRAFKTARGGFDIFVPFMERGLQLLCDKGMLAYITPNKLLSAKYADSLRQYFTSHAQLRSLTDLSSVPVFGAAVYPFITIGTKCRHAKCDTTVDVFTTANGALDRVTLKHVQRVPMSIARRGNHSWSLLVDPSVDQLAPALEAELVLEHIATVSASSTVDEAYKWKSAINDDGRVLRRAIGGRYVPFIVSGNIRPFSHTWETHGVKYLRKVYHQPVIDGQHDAISQRRYKQMHTPKIIASGMSKRPTCTWVRDPIAAGVATVLIIPKDGIDGLYLAGLLNSTTMERLYRVLFGSLSLAGGYMRFGSPQFKLLPVPTASHSEQRIIARLVEKCLDRGDAIDSSVLSEIDDRVARLYGIE